MKSPRRVPTAISRSACPAMRLAASPPVTPMPPRFQGLSQGSTPLPAWVSAKGTRNRAQKLFSSRAASE